ncbi:MULTISPECIES: Na+/H+ antiporter [Rhodomicrobium]|uniref:Na+/H+ antiporter n=1 Tax=Rhodomicrobium TaxID=1068 RepID=UPI000B4B1535|nr:MULTISPECIES: Na+/H+ antiporter [Rhodomicrobium]
MAEMMHTLLMLAAVLAMGAVVARKLDVAPSIVLLIAGLTLALIPGFPTVELAPELVLLGILPPLIYSAGVAMSWREFRFNLRPIILLAFGGVIFTTCAVALAAHWLLGMPLGVAFVLGAIVAPPDTVAPIAIARRLGLPRRLLVVLEGEGLADDATALILYRFAVAAVATGVFEFGEAVGGFALIVLGEIAWGLVIGWLSLRLRRWAHDPRVEITLSLMTPYLAFWFPEHVGGSGVLATVTAGLFVSWNGPLLIPSATRLQGIFFWDLAIYLLEGSVFLVTGLQARTILDRIGEEGVRDVIASTFVVLLVLIVTRFIWVYPAIYLPRWLSPALAVRDPAPPWQQPFLIAFVGVRGVVSLAAALAIPLTTSTGAPFPYRDEMLSITFGIIILTLVGQGLVLPAIVRWLGLGTIQSAEALREEADEIRARRNALNMVKRRLDELEAKGDLPPEVLTALHRRQEHRVSRLPQPASEGGEPLHRISELKYQLITLERNYIHNLLRDGKITDESRRRIERELDLEEASIACRVDGSAELPI